MYEKVKIRSSKRHAMIELDPKHLVIAIFICALAAGITSQLKASVGRPEIVVCGEE